MFFILSSAGFGGKHGRKTIDGGRLNIHSKKSARRYLGNVWFSRNLNRPKNVTYLQGRGRSLSLRNESKNHYGKPAGFVKCVVKP